MDRVNIRKAKMRDLNAIGSLWKEYMDFHKSRDSHFGRTKNGHEVFKKFVAGHMASGASYVLVAERDGNVVGYCLAALAKYPPVFRERDYGTIFDLAVNEPCRRNGIGEKLYREARRWFCGNKIRRIELRVAVSNEISTAFWKKMGFRPFVTTVVKHV